MTRGYGLVYILPGCFCTKTCAFPVPGRGLIRAGSPAYSNAKDTVGMLRKRLANPLLYRGFERCRRLNDIYPDGQNLT